MREKAIILLSGGIDSAVCCAIAKQWGYDLSAISFDYGQRHISELEAAKKIAEWFNIVEHKIMKIPTLRDITDVEPYVPARNTIFLSFALGYAEIIGATNVFVGMNADDSYFPDCTMAYFHAINSLATVALKEKKIINAPLLRCTKAKIISRAVALKVPLGKTITCYDGDNCGVCYSCLTRLRGFKDAGFIDPIKYKDNSNR